jgi:hypothetical protein
MKKMIGNLTVVFAVLNFGLAGLLIYQGQYLSSLINLAAGTYIVYVICIMFLY